MQIFLRRTRQSASDGRLSIRSPDNFMVPPAIRPRGSSKRIIAQLGIDLPEPDLPTTLRVSPTPIENDMFSPAINITCVSALDTQVIYLKERWHVRPPNAE